MPLALARVHYEQARAHGASSPVALEIFDREPTNGELTRIHDLVTATVPVRQIQKISAV